MTRCTTVLYAEDDENDAFFMQRAFVKLNRADDLRIVGDGQMAVDYLSGVEEFSNRERFPLPHMIILDVKMPMMSGLETLAWIRARREFDALPVVMFTSSTQESDIEFSRTHGANGYFVKPSNADQLSRVAGSILENCGSISPRHPRLPVEGNLL